MEIRARTFAAMRRARTWSNANPLYTLAAAALLVVAAKPAWHGVTRSALALWPPTLTGSWEGSGMSMSLVEDHRRIIGTGSLGGSIALSIAGNGTGRAADLVLTTHPDQRGASRRLTMTTTMSDRSTLVLRGLSLNGPGLFDDIVGSPAEWRLTRR